jgi:hypothetical protein
MMRPRASLFAVTLVVLLAACTGTAAPSGAPAENRSTVPSDAGASPADPGSLPPDEPVSGQPGGGTSDPGDPGNVGGGGGGGVNPDPGQPQQVVPVPGQLDVHPVQIEELVAQVEGRHAVLNAIWTSGVEPCYVLDSVFWKLDPGTKVVEVSVREGRGPGDQMCIEIAVQKATVIDLGELEPGTYTVHAADGMAADITFTIS